MQIERSARGEASRGGSHSHSGMLLVAGLLVGLCLTRFHSHLLFHGVVEIFTVAVAWSIFFLAWNARRFLDSGYLLFIGIASLFTGIIDVLHTLAYKGMGVFPAAGADLATQLWVAGRYVQSLSFLIALIFLRRGLRLTLTLGAYAAVTAALLAAVLYRVFPVCYVEGVGLTPFKVISEYAVVLVLLASIFLLFRNRTEFNPDVVGWLAASLALTIAAELAFTLYTDVYGAANIIGHLLRFLAFCFVYRAIVVTGLIKPYDLLFRNLTRSEEALRRSEERYRVFVANTTEGICRVEMEPRLPVSLPEDEQVRYLLERGRIAECNEAYARMYGLARAAGARGARLADMLGRSEPSGAEIARAFIRSGYRMLEVESCVSDPGVARRSIAGSLTGVVEDGHLVRIWGLQRDITDRKRAAAERERLIAELQQALAEVRTLTGLLPICAHCKKIRDDQGYWTQVESYIGQRAHVSFSHGICPGCLKELYPDLYPEIPSQPER